jgi:hypothetical protein
MHLLGNLSYLAALSYLATAVLALVAGARHRAALQRWILVAVAFVMLAAWRLADGEALLQDRVRTWTRNSGTYDDRHVFQVPVTLGAVLILALIVWLGWGTRRAGRPGQALCATAIMLVFTAVRAVSLHAIDAILYHSIGPVHVNYLIDLGLTAVVAGLALTNLPAQPEHRAKSRSRSRRRSRKV